MFLRKVALGLGAGALTVGGLFASAAGATASPVARDMDTSTGTVVGSSVSVQGTLPGCASYGHSGQSAWVYNGCSYTIHAKIIWAFASDTACYTLSPGEQLNSSRSGLARFDGAVSC